MRRMVTGSRRAIALLLGAALLAAACGADGDRAEPADETTSTSGVAVGTQEPSATTLPGGGPGSGGGGPAGGGGAGGVVTPTTATTAAEASVIAVGSRRVGEVAPPLLQPGRGDRVVLEVRAQAGAGPDSATVDHVVQALRDASRKAVSVDGVDPLAGSARDWTARDIVAAAAGAAQVESGRDQVVLRLLFLRGTFEGNADILGVAVSGDVAAVFSDRVEAAAGLLVAPAVVEDAVTMHEVGHLLGLVDLLLGSGRGDPEHPGHSRNRRSVMFWQVESGLITQLLDGGIPRDFDADDRAELAQIRAG